MPLLPGSSQKVISQNIREFHGGDTYARTKAKFGKDKANKQAVAVAMNEARKMRRADGGGVTTGALTGEVPGRTDHKTIKVPNGSYVFPSDIVSALGDGNTFAGSKVFDNMFKSGPYGIKAPKIKKPRGYTRGKMRPYRPRFHFADGGALAFPGDDEDTAPEEQGLGAAAGFAPASPEIADQSAPQGLAAAAPAPPGLEPPADDVDDTEPVEIEAADGEYIATPEELMRWAGTDDIAQAHRIADSFVKQIRAGNIERLANLPGPAQD